MSDVQPINFDPEDMTDLYTLYKSDLEFVKVLKQNANNEFLKNNGGGGGEGGDITASQITDSTTIGRSVLTAETAAEARTAIGAGTSNLAIGETATDAKAGDYQPTWAQVSGKPTTFAPVAATASVIGGVKTAAAPEIVIDDPVDAVDIQAAFDALILALKTAGVLT